MYWTDLITTFTIKILHTVQNIIWKLIYSAFPNYLTASLFCTIMMNKQRWNSSDKVPRTHTPLCFTDMVQASLITMPCTSFCLWKLIKVCRQNCHIKYVVLYFAGVMNIKVTVFRQKTHEWLKYPLFKFTT